MSSIGTRGSLRDPPHAFVDRPLDGGHRGTMPPADVQDDAVGADRIGGQLGTIEDEVWPQRHDRPVLGAQRLAFGPVGKDHRTALAAFRDGRPFARHREASPAPPEQAARLEDRDQAVGRRTRPEPSFVIDEGLGVGIGRRTGQDSL